MEFKMDPNIHSIVNQDSNFRKTIGKNDSVSQVKIDDKGIIHFPDGRKFRIGRITIEDKTLNFSDLNKEDQKFKQKVEDEVAKNLQRFCKTDELKKDDGTYKLSLSKEKVTLQTSTEKVMVKETIKKYEKNLNTIQASGLKIIKKIEEIEVNKHIFTKSPMGTAKSIAIKVGTVAAVILASPLLLVAGVAINAGVWIHKTIKKDSIVNEAEILTKKTEQYKWSGLKEIYTSQVGGGISVTKGFSSNEEKLKVLQNKLERHLMLSFKRNGKNYDNTIFRDLQSNLKLNDFANLETLKSKIRNLAPESNKILSDDEILDLYQESKAAFMDTSRADQEKIANLLETFETKPVDFTAANQEITAKLRDVIDSPTYQALKEDAENEYVKLVHKLSCGIWNNVKALPAYQEFGEKVLKDIDSYKGLDGKPIDGKKMVEILNESHHYLEKKLFTDHGLIQKVIFAFTHPEMSFRAASSEGGMLREMVGAFGFGTFDPHGTANNNPSIQGTTRASIINGEETINATINNCYGGSPTISNRTGTQIAQEFHAVCQAAENNQFAKTKDNSIPSIVYYTSLQDIENTGHGDDERSFALMELNKKYPLSFLGMTLAKDSDFYMMRGKYKNPEWKGIEDYSAQVFKQFESKKCYQYGDRTRGETGHGMYLPGGQEKWKPILSAIQNNAIAHFESIKDEDPKKLRGAYQEYVYSMIEAYIELEIAKEIYERTGNKTPLIMTMKLCKGNLDRGGAENAKNLYTRMPSDHTQFSSTVLGAFEGRALTTCDRIILPDRLPQVLSFIELVDKKQFEQDLLNLCEGLGISFKNDQAPAFTPALSVA